ncbi:PREDICTED: uncharacterized protein LOC108799987 [Nanorana parkeri]|uniref:uncharacterized protein LOC108799987 n=1 Tax=Nanorana parkeri TaxID=125878 RepID=UPI000854C8D3|nr:PREDICTED: uncharacterized protein LOC108799987 [Nanorana parkeri]
MCDDVTVHARGNITRMRDDVTAGCHPFSVSGDTQTRDAPDYMSTFVHLHYMNECWWIADRSVFDELETYGSSSPRLFGNTSLKGGAAVECGCVPVSLLSLRSLIITAAPSCCCAVSVPDPAIVWGGSDSQDTDCRTPGSGTRRTDYRGHRTSPSTSHCWSTARDHYHLSTSWRALPGPASFLLLPADMCLAAMKMHSLLASDILL